MRALLVLLLVLPGLATPGSPAPEGNIPDLPEPLADAMRNATHEAQETSGVNATLEDVNVTLHVDFEDLDVDIPGILFGGGRAYAFVRATAQVDLHAVSAARVEDALRSASRQTNVSLDAYGINSSRQVIPADVLRSTLAGEALDLLKQAQERALLTYVDGALPGVTVLSSRLDWQHDNPLTTPPDSDARDPPLTLNASLDLQFLRRITLRDVLDRSNSPSNTPEPDASSAAAPTDPEARKKWLTERLKEQNRVPVYDRNVFSILGFEQLLRIPADPGWRVHVTLELPEGYSFESYTPGTRVNALLQIAETRTDARDSATALETASVVAISNRFLVAASLLTASLALGLTLQVPVHLVASRLVTRRLRR